MKSVLSIIGAILAAASSLRAEDDAQAQAIMDKLVAADLANDYEAFVADGTPGLQAALSKTQFSAAAQMLNPRFAQPHDLTLLGEVNQRGCETYLYRFRFSGGGDDILATLTLKDGKVAGILFH